MTITHRGKKAIHSRTLSRSGGECNPQGGGKGKNPSLPKGKETATSLPLTEERTIHHQYGGEKERKEVHVIHGPRPHQKKKKGTFIPLLRKNYSRSVCLKEGEGGGGRPSLTAEKGKGKGGSPEFLL